MPESRTPLGFENAVVVVTGAGAGLGRRYARDFAAAGAVVVVHARREEAAAEVITEIENAGGRAVSAVVDAREGGRIVDTAIEACGRIDALVVNAGLVRDRTFARMSAAEWTEVVDVHLGGAYAVTAATWPHMMRQGGGRIVLTTSGAGLHGNFGQANYAAAKAGIIGLAKTLSIEGMRYGIGVNAVAPMAHTAMTDQVFDDDLREGLPAASVSPFVMALAHPACARTGAILEIGGGWAAELRWERAAGLRFEPDELTAAAVLDRHAELADFTTGTSHPTTTADSLAAALGRITG
jgi:NAD(P)-dependent dehydrogenase (short-subunit alcohol dehydrogenase family)